MCAFGGPFVCFSLLRVLVRVLVAGISFVCDVCLWSLFVVCLLVGLAFCLLLCLFAVVVVRVDCCLCFVCVVALVCFGSVDWLCLSCAVVCVVLYVFFWGGLSVGLPKMFASLYGCCGLCFGCWHA